MDDLGYVQQAELFELVRDQFSATSVVVDAHDVLQDPRQLLTLLCEALGVPFSERMLSWPAGRRPTDGVWGKHWYGTVERSTGFMPYRPKTKTLPASLRALADACEPHYQALYRHRLGQ